MSKLLDVEVSAAAAEQIRIAEAWWRTNRPNHLYYRVCKAPRRVEILGFWHSGREGQPPI